MCFSYLFTIAHLELPINLYLFQEEIFKSVLLDNQKSNRVGIMNWVFVFCLLSSFCRVLICNRPVLADYSWLGVIFVPYDVKPDTVIYRFQATDNEALPDYPLSFSINDLTGENLVNMVKVSYNEADLVLRRPLTKGRSYQLRLRVTDTANEETVQDFKLNATEASESSTMSFLTYPKEIIRVSESAEVGGSVATIVAKRRDRSKGPIQLTLTPNTTKFALTTFYGEDETQVRVKLIEALDFEKRDLYDLSIIYHRLATNSPPDSRNIIAIPIQIIVVDVQDTNPIFINLPSLTRIKSDIPEGQLILKAEAKDGDKTNHRQIVYSIQGSNARLFKMDAVTGHLTTSQPGFKIFQSCCDSAITLEVKAEERGSGASTVQEIVIFVESSIQSKPKFSSDHYKATVDENPPVLTNLVFEQRVHLEDEGNCNILRIEVQDINTARKSEILDVNPTLASREADIKVYVKKPDVLDYEKEPTYTFHLIAYPDQQTANPFTSTATVTLTLNDVNDNSPTFSSKTYDKQISESASAGTTIIHETATDLDKSNSGLSIQYKLTGDPQITKLFNINRDSGLVTLANSGQLDREMIDYYEFQVEACDEDGRGACASTTIKLTITDSNDNRPIFDRESYQTCISDEMRRGEMIFHLRAVDKDQPGSDNSKINYKIAHGDRNSDFEVDSDGRLSLRRDVSQMDKGSTQLLIKATDGGNPQQSSETIVHISSDQNKCGRHVIEYIIPKSSNNVEDNRKTIESLLTRLNSGSMTRITEIKKDGGSSSDNSRTRVVTSVIQQQNQSIVDLSVFGNIFNQSSGTANGAQNVDRETATASVENTVWKWILIALLILLVIVLILLLCCCLCKPNTKYMKTTQVYNKNKNPSEIMGHHTARRHHRHRRQNDRILSAPIANGKTNIPYSRHLQDDNSLTNSAMTRQNHTTNSAVKRQQPTMLNVETVAIKRDSSNVVTDLNIQNNVVVSEETILDGADDNRSRTQLKNQFLEKKSLFTIAYDGMHSRHDLLKDQDYPATTNTPIS